jgi:hypothetical protein
VSRGALLSEDSSSEETASQSLASSSAMGGWLLTVRRRKYGLPLFGLVLESSPIIGITLYIRRGLYIYQREKNLENKICFYYLINLYPIPITVRSTW